MPEAYISRVANRLGAVALTLSDGIRDATEEATGMAGGGPAASISLREWADGHSVDVLAEAMRVSHSRAVRVVDRLEAEGLARREPDPSDGRRALVRLEPAGRELAERALGCPVARPARRPSRSSGAADARDLERAARCAARPTTVDSARGAGDVPALRRARLWALRGCVPGEPSRGSAASGGVTSHARPGGAFALAAVAPLFFSAGGDVINNMVLAAAYVVMALGLNVIVGFAGLLDLGYVAFFAIGAYTAAYFASGYWANAGSDARGISILAGDSVAGTPGIHLNFLLILALAVAATALAGALIGVPTLRLRGDYIAIVTLAFGEIIGHVLSNGREIELFGGTLTSGPNGIGPIDPIELPWIGPFETLDLRPWYWFALALVAVALIVNVRLRDSRLGRAWRACARTRRSPPARGSRSSGPSCWPTPRAPRLAGCRARSSRRT